MATLLLSGASAATPDLAELGVRLGMEIVIPAGQEDELAAGRAAGVLVIAPETVADPVGLCGRAVNAGWRTLWLHEQERDGDDLARRMFGAGALDYLELPLDPRRAGPRLERAARPDATALLDSPVDARLVGDLSHDVTNCQFGLTATLEVMAETAPSDRDRVQVLRSELSRLGAVIADLVMLCRPLPPDAGGTSPSAAAERAVLASELLAGQLGVQIEKQLEPTPPVAASGRRLTEVVQRLIEHGLRRSSAPGPLRVRTRRTDLPGLEVELSVENNGPPLPDAERTAVSGSLTAGSRGAGVGLAVIRRVVERLGGLMSTAEPAGGGVVLTVRLPG